MIDLGSDFDVLVATIDGEAEGEPLIGKEAVAAVIMNRVAQHATHHHFGDGTVRGACLAPWQFSTWNPGDNPDRDRVMALDLNKPYPALSDCITVAQMALSNELVDPTGGATYYFADSIAPPPWVVGATFCGQFGAQRFYRNVK